MWTCINEEETDEQLDAFGPRGTERLDSVVLPQPPSDTPRPLRESLVVLVVRLGITTDVSGCPRSAGSHIRPQTLEIPTVEGKRYLVSMLGKDSDWVKNVEAAHGYAVIRQGRRRQVRLVAVSPDQRAPILREYVRIASSGRRHFPLPVGAPLADFEAIAGRYPVYRIDPS